MISIKARIEKGYLVSVNPVNMPEGTELEVTANSHETNDDEQMTEENWPKTSEERTRLLARMDSRQPPKSTDEELAQWTRIRAEDQRRELAESEERDLRIRKVWE